MFFRVDVQKSPQVVLVYYVRNPDAYIIKVAHIGLIQKLI